MNANNTDSSQPPIFNLVGISNRSTMHAIFGDAQKRHKLVSVIGYPGAGKTTASEEYRQGNSNAHLVTAKNVMNRKQLFAEILAEMGVSYSGTVYDMLKAIIHELNAQKNPLLIVDEAGKLGTNHLLDLHDLRNATMHNAGIVLVGVDYLKTNMKKAADRQRQGFPEFYSRIMNWNELALPTKREIEAICKANGVSDPEVIGRFQRLKNYRDVYNAITNETTVSA